MQRAVAQRRCAIAKSEVFHAPGPPVGAGLESAGFDQDLAKLLAPAAGVLIHRAAHGAGHPDAEFEAAQARIGRDPRESHHLEAGAGTYSSPFDFEVAVDHAHDQPLDAGVGDEQVGARAEQEVRDAAQAAALDDDLDRFGPGRLGEELGRPADAERGARRQRLALAHTRQVAQPGEVSAFAPAHRPAF